MGGLHSAEGHWRMREVRGTSTTVRKRQRRSHYLEVGKGFRHEEKLTGGFAHTHTWHFCKRKSAEVKPRTKFNYTNGFSHYRLPPRTQRSTNTVATLKVCHGCGLDHMLSDKKNKQDTFPLSASHLSAPHLQPPAHWTPVCLALTMYVQQWSASVCGCCCWATCGEAVAASCAEKGGGRWRRAIAGVLAASPAAAGSHAGSSPGLRSGRSVSAWGALPGCPGGSPPCLPAGPCLPRLHHKKHHYQPNEWIVKVAKINQM